MRLHSNTPIPSPLSTNGERRNEWGRAPSQRCPHPAPLCYVQRSHVPTFNVRTFPRSTFPRSHVQRSHVPIPSPLSTNGERRNEWGRAPSQRCPHPAPLCYVQRSHVPTFNVRTFPRSTFPRSHVQRSHVPIPSPLSTNGERRNEWGRAPSQRCPHPAPLCYVQRSHVPTFNVPTFPRSTFPRSHVQRSHVPTFPRSTFPRSHVQRSHVPVPSPLSTNGERRNEWGRAPSQRCPHPAPLCYVQRSHVPTFNVPTFPRSTFPRSTFNGIRATPHRSDTHTSPAIPASSRCYTRAPAAACSAHCE